MSLSNQLNPELPLATVGYAGMNGKILSRLLKLLTGGRSDEGAGADLEVQSIEIEYWPVGSERPSLFLTRHLCTEIVKQLVAYLHLAKNEAETKSQSLIAAFLLGIDAASEFHYLTPLLLVAAVQAGITFVPIRAAKFSSVLAECSRLGVNLFAAWRYVEQSNEDNGVRVMRVDFQNDVDGLSASLYLHLLLDQLPKQQKQPSRHNNEFVYCIRTSGSTGTPKLVWVPDACIASNVVCLADNVMRLQPNSRLLWSSPLDFDPSLIEIFCARYAGCCLVVTGERMRPAVAVASVTHLQTTPSQLFILLASATSNNFNFHHLKCLLLGGEPCPPLLSLKPLLRSCLGDQKLDIVNVYGATELSVWASAHRLENDHDDTSVSLGLPLADTWIRLVDPESGHPLAEILDTNQGWKLFDKDGNIMTSFTSTNQAASVASIEGEILMSRSGRRCFVDSGVDKDSNNDEVWHHSGDLAKFYPATGRLLFLGRKDRRVKRFGVMLSPEALDRLLSAGLYPEFPTAMEAHTLSEPGTDFLVCLARPLTFESLSAFEQLSILAAVGKRADAYLPGGRRCLPDELLILPSHSEGFVLTNNGKVDLLATLKRQRARQDESRNANNMLNLVHNLWALHTGSVPNQSDSITFAQCGGDSLGAVRIAARLGLSSVAEQIIGWTFDELVSRASLSHLPSKTQSVGESILNHSVSLHKTDSAAVIAWRINLGSCVDSCPFVSSSSNGRVFGVSFDGKIASASAADGQLNWSRCLPAGGKVDCALTGSIDNRYLIVVLDINGRCQMHFLSLEDGSTQWQLDLPSRVRRAPRPVAWDSNLLVLGCHDASLYTISLSRRACIGTVLRLPPRSGPVADLLSIDGHASEAAASTRATLVACLSGRLLLVAWPAGQGLRWRVDLGSPCLHRPCLALSSTVACVGLADGIVVSVSMTTGEILWRSSLNSTSLGPIVVSGELLVVGDGNYQVKCLNAVSGQCVCEIDLNGPVISEPVVLKTDESGNAVFAVTDTNGGVYFLRLSYASQLDVLQPSLINPKRVDLSKDSPSSVCLHRDWFYQLPGQCFTPAVLWSGHSKDLRIFLGCRDDNLYCLRLPDF